MNEKVIAETAASGSGGQITRRDGLKLVAAGMAAALLPYTSRIETLGKSFQSTPRKKERDHE